MTSEKGERDKRSESALSPSTQIARRYRRDKRTRGADQAYAA